MIGSSIWSFYIYLLSTRYSTVTELSTEQLLREAWRQRGLGHYKQCKDLIDQASELCVDDDYLTWGRLYHIYMQIEADHDRFDKALSYSRKSVSFYERSKNPPRLAHATRHLADLECHLDMLTESYNHYKKALDHYRQNNSPAMDLANTLRGLAILLEKSNDLDAAREAWKEARDIYDKYGIKEGVDEAEERLLKLK